VLSVEGWFEDLSASGHLIKSASINLGGKRSHQLYFGALTDVSERPLGKESVVLHHTELCDRERFVFLDAIDPVELAL